MGKKTLHYIFNTDTGLEILSRHYHPISGATLKLAALNGRCRAKYPNAKPYIVFWAAPWQKTVKDYKSFPTLIGAQRCFNRLKQLPPPVTPALLRDFQREKVYEWERKLIDRHSPNNMTEEHMARIVQRISDDFNMKAPAINYDRSKPVSYYYPGKHAICMATSKLTHITHEAGHGVDAKINGNKWSDHGPSFVRTIIRLADRYQVWQDPVKLEEEARAMGILVADDADLPPLPG